MQNFVLASVGTITLVDKATGDIVLRSNTLVDSGINFTTTAEDIRGGLANKLLAQYFHDSAMSLTLNDAMFNLQYLALNVGGTITVGGDIMKSEQVVANEGSFTVSEGAKPFLNLGTIGWYSKVGEDDWKKVTFDGSTATAQVHAGEALCVKYVAEDASIEQFVVSAAFVPNQCYALLTLPLFKGTKTEDFSSSSRAGEVQVEIPSFLLNGTQELSLSASGAATTSLSGNALAVMDGSEGCDGDGYYAKLKQITFNKDEFADVKAIAISDSVINLVAGEQQQLEVLALYTTFAPREIGTSKLTFSSKDNAVATVSNDGIVSAVAAGSTTIEVFVTGHDTLEASAVVTVTAS